MAGDWLKMEHSTPDKPEVLAITVKMGWEDPDMTLGKLFRLWRWFDQHTVDGNAVGVTPALLDRLLGVTGLTLAVASVGWLIVTEEGITLQNFDRHNGNSAKNRAQTAKRVAKHKSNGAANAKGNGDSVTSALPREEKRREEVIPPKSPKGVDQRFETFYAAYPKKVGKDAALKAFAKRKPDDQLVEQMVSAIERQKRSDAWLKDGGQFIPNPATWLNQGRWQDEETPAAANESGFSNPLFAMGVK